MKKQSMINLLAQFVMLAVNLCISFFLTPYISESLGVDAYGFVGLANDFVGYIQIITIALNSMASRFITIKLHEGNIEGANKYYSSVIISNVIISIFLAIIGTIFIIFMDKIINIPTSLLLDIQLLFFFMLANFIISVLTSTFAVATFCTNKLYLTSIKTIISQIARALILLISCVVCHPSVYIVGLAAFVSTSYLGFCNYKFSKQLTPELNISRKYFEFKYVKDLLSSGIWNSISKLSGILSNGLDLLISNVFLGSTSMGIISLSKTLPNAILNAFGSISSIFSPELTISYAKKDYINMKKQLIFSIKLLGFFSAIPMTIIFSYGANFYYLWVPSQNSMLLYYLTCVSVLGMCISLPLEPLWNIFTVTNKVKKSALFLLMNSILTFILVLILFAFFPRIEVRMFIIVGVSVSFSIIRSLTFLPMYGAKCIGLDKSVFYPSILKNLTVIILATLCSITVKNFINIDNWLKFIIVSCVSAIICVLLSFIIVMTKEDRKKIYNILYVKLKRGGNYDDKKIND